MHAADGRTPEIKREKKTMFGFAKGKVKTTLTITGESPITETERYVYDVTVSDDLEVSVEERGGEESAEEN